MIKMVIGLMWCGIVAGCAGGQKIYKPQTITAAVIEKEMIKPNEVVHVRYSSGTGGIFEEDGYFKGFTDSTRVEFEFFSMGHRQYVKAIIPLQNILEIRVKKNTYKKEQLISAVALLGVAVLLSIGIWAQ
ncbi:hypothetical protein HUU42_02195 [bacterium]|nr:hypothetical protein [bacterium]